MLADDLIGAIALDALGSRIPAGDVAVGIEAIERVVGDALHQHAELGFGVGARGLDLALPAAGVGERARELMRLLKRLDARVLVAARPADRAGRCARAE